MSHNIERGDVYYCHLKANGSIQGGLRPVVIIQNNTGNSFSSTTIVVPLTTQIKNIKQPTHCLITIHHKNSPDVLNMGLTEQILTINQCQLQNKVCHLSNLELKKIEKCVLISLSIN